ncbi:MAG TPA: DUF2442 domain-containing protein [Candidatus Onthomorpha intestinigallinarum]|uniref:DUF2442 domain-containing protein n=1 Tax=Candidatus Onthomorpha intestinigallinarum TaxID=2840880 RepID=A0A9D1UIB4_9BACT|nr:DUF2442 domain-containing protein [Candidatus Onthomorpha intestinigallinarum]
MEKITRIWLTDSEIWIQTEDGRTASESFADYPRLRYATRVQRESYTYDAFGIHWEELEEDLSFEGFFRKKEYTPLYRLFMEHPELNASAVARRMGLSQSLFAQYICGAKKPSEKRYREILKTIHDIGKELESINDVSGKVEYALSV